MQSAEPVTTVGARRCGAKTKAGTPCQRWGMPNGRCSRHGGRTPPPGPSHPNYRHGARSKLRLKPDLLRRLNEAAADPDLMTVNRDVEALEARQGELLERIDSAASADFCANVVKLLAAIRSTDAEAIGELLPLIEQQASTEARNVETWREYERVADSKRKLIESHRKSQAEAGQTVSIAMMAMTLERMMYGTLQAASLEAARLASRQLYAQFMGVYDQPQNQPRIEQGPVTVVDHGNADGWKPPEGRDDGP